LIAYKGEIQVELHEELNIGQGPFDKNAALTRKLNKLLEMVQRLQASQAALISTLKQVPASDGEAMLSPKRWAYFQEHLEKELESFKLK
jgi:hypothetical protein